MLSFNESLHHEVAESKSIDMEDAEVIEVDSSRDEEVEEAQFKNVASTELIACSSHNKAFNQVTESLDVEVIGVDSSTEENEEEAQLHDVTSKLVVCCSSLKNVDDAISLAADEQKTVQNSETEPRRTTERAQSRESELQPIIEMEMDETEASNISVTEMSDVARKNVMDTLLAFRSIYDSILQQSEKSMRSDQLAYKHYREKNGGSSCIQRFIGDVPGVKIGDEFHLRVEMCVIGLHRQHQAGIDYIKQRGKTMAISIVSSGRYSNEQNDSDVLLYSGAGSSHEDQKLERGNLALKNSIDARIPIRVIHGFKKCFGGKQEETYVYDGLYLAEECLVTKNKQGHNTLMFRLRKTPGQPEISIDKMKQTVISSSSTEALCTNDISNGEEAMPIRVVNAVDRDIPMPFKYIKEMTFPSSYSPVPPAGCNCVNECWNSKKCACASKNGGKFPFKRGGAILEAKPLVYECGPSCNCPPSCRNRVCQRGIKLELEVFRTESRGWGVRSPYFIPSGSFICEYAGEILTDEEAQTRTNDEYLFAIGNNCNQDNDHATPITSLQNEASFAVDALKYGNVGRFINHSCSPNLFAQNLLYVHDDTRMPHIMLVAWKDIQPFEELTYDYNYAIDQVHDSNGNIKKKECHCGSQECTGWLY